MSVRNLRYLFEPKSVAVIGASESPDSVGHVVMRNLLEGGFSGPVLPINPKYKSVCGVLAYPTVDKAPEHADLAIICTPASIVPNLIDELGHAGTRAAIVLSAGMRPDKLGARNLSEEALKAAGAHGMRLLGPNCIGLLVPGHGLNASFAHLPALPGKLAFISQSGALCTAILDWAKERRIGFSHFVSLGDQADVDFGDMLDYLGGDGHVSGILLYVEAIDEARKFMSAARAAARNKPVLVLKSGRQPAGAAAAASHTGALAGQDNVYDAAIRRAGMLRVYDIDELFDAVENLARAWPLKGEKLTILTNGGGPGVLAADAVIEQGGRLADLSEETISKLDEYLPPNWSRSNPVDIIGDADPKRFQYAAETLLSDETLEALLIINIPTAVTPCIEAARALIPVLRNAHKPVLTSWLGGETARDARQLFSDAGISTFDTPARAVSAFQQMVRFKVNQEQLMQIPPAVARELTPDTEKVRRIIECAVDRKQEWLSLPDALNVLKAYEIPVAESHLAPNVSDVATAAEQIGTPVAVKIVSKDILHKSDVGGVQTDLPSPAAAEDAAIQMAKQACEANPNVEIQGFLVQRMVPRGYSHELLLGMKSDAVFGPVIVFGQGGTAVEVLGDIAVALPPLNMHLAADLVSRTRTSRLLKGYRGRQAADLEAIYLTLLKFSQLVIDVPEIVELDINPLLAGPDGVVAADARIRVSAAYSGADRLAILPYPDELEEHIELEDGRHVLLRPIRPEDEPAHQEFFQHLKPVDIHFRFFGLVRNFPHSQMARFTQIDYDREMAIIAQLEEDGEQRTVAVVRSVSNPDKTRAEFAIIVRSDLKGHGLGQILTEKIIAYCRDRGIGELMGQIQADNTPMLRLAKKCGFVQCGYPEAGVIEVKLSLTPNVK